jgi:NADPH-dependent 2,4-dienoyl-CoA reductase/sulfur reductase-like enzyme
VTFPYILEPVEKNDQLGRWEDSCPVTNRKRVAIVGAGHIALVCTCYLAKAGHEVTMFERRSRPGGAVNTEEIWRISYE